MIVHGASTGREYKRGDTSRRPVARAASRPARRVALPRAVAFWLVAGVLFLLFFAAAASAPLYGVYQSRWRYHPYRTAPHRPGLLRGDRRARRSGGRQPDLA
jgi:hypothetical protein